MAAPLLHLNQTAAAGGGEEDEGGTCRFFFAGHLETLGGCPSPTVSAV